MLNDVQNIKRQYVWTAGIVAVILIFAAKIHLQLLDTIDRLFSNLIQDGMQIWLTVVMKMITHIADTKLGLIYAILIALYLWFGRRQRVDAIWTLATMFGGVAIAFVVKEIVKRPRPNINQVIPETGYSMPSGHTFEAVLVIAFLYLFFIRPIQNGTVKTLLYRLCYVWIILVMWSRIYLGAHYLSDTIVAVAIAIVWLSVALWLYKRYYELVASFVNPVGRHQRKDFLNR
ncbi:phosphatase PAP2 family protein [Pediococcus claussenii]|uniref:PAP2 superfamily protein n=1 Tax=Pediococcus claussenii (strain ATCC BAA-344 / DSM 14800 / JCM 18046 / KCTC 3811 / LMG 21948 / P06) TaxID=701521 RepID=G8PE75_PEDCP|nr:phosphatase PAP2 family protein [Pediococcus claussenii]AEV95560.1 PAP2 superfamily protein [Pediococcus claussenii ATCC BAA-344]ANZ69083.1 phospholipid phosphatase [Pediococcus claussenii]ANZ70899.1 phospholipid phosphatase [Pediococcus claussenii]KRN20206.1 hypothetical protein IV79_GL000873 [Pediococcus claussenii]